MTTLVKVIVSALISVLFVSCQFNFGVRGDGNVVTLDREVSEDFTTIEVSRGLDVYITQGNSDEISVQADENLQDIIKTEVNNGVLSIYAEENISYANSKKIMVTFDQLDRISTSSGSDLVSTNRLKIDELYIESSSGSDIELSIDAEKIVCQASSGSDIKISGTTNTFNAEATSGSDIKAGGLQAVSARAEANSGADITVNTSKALTARANSGGDIKYYGNPEKVDKSDGPSGSVRQQ